MEVTVAAITPVQNKECVIFCRMSRIRPVTPKPAPQW